MGIWEIKLSREPSGTKTRAAEDATTNEQSVQLADLATKDSIVAVAAEDDSHYDYYFLKVTSDGVIRLQRRTSRIPMATYTLKTNQSYLETSFLESI